MRRIGRVAGVVLLGLLVALLWLRSRPSSAPVSTTRAPSPLQPAPRVAPPVRARPAAPSSPPAPAPRPAPPDCIPAAEERCREGDLWLLDSCGRPEEKLEECAERPCRDDGCEPPYQGFCEEPPEGRCDGDTVRLCLAGRPIAIDCRAKGLRCGQGNEGAECKPELPRAEQCRGPTRCEGDQLLRCRDGRLEQIDCSALGARCLLLPSAKQPRCVEVAAPAMLELGCGPCGCPVDGAQRERACDGRDEDGDGRIDEGLDCGVVPVIAFVVTGGQGQTSHAAEDIEQALHDVNRALAGEAGEPPLTVALEELVYLEDASLLTLDQAAFSRLLSDSRLQRARDTFYVPLVFTDEILAGGDTPKPGVSTLPNGTCGDMQESRGPELGLIAVAKARYPTTVAHELGHFLGLCHTHDQQEAFAPAIAFADPLTSALTTCRPSCRGEGDGLCDTPFDPGPESCTYDPSCRPACSAVAAPDTENLMGYYAHCRRRFSDEQIALMQHTLALRRGWHRCLFGACSCTLGADECPVGMSCRSAQRSAGDQAARCVLDGPRGPGAECGDGADCGQGATCMTNSESGVSRCIRPCLTSTSDCECAKVADDLSVCTQDLGSPR